MWSTEESETIKSSAKIRPGIVTYALPYGMQVEKGSVAIVEHLVEQIPRLLASLNGQ